MQYKRMEQSYTAPVVGARMLVRGSTLPYLIAWHHSHTFVRFDL